MNRTITDTPADQTEGALARSHAAFTRFTAFLAGTATIWIFVVMFLIVADVIGLKLFNSPLYGVVETTAASIVPVVFLQLAYGLHTGRMTRADFLIGAMEKTKPFAARCLNTAYHLFGLIIFVLITWAIWPEVVSAWQENEYYGARGVFTAPIWPIKLLTVVGAAATAIEFAFLLAGNIAGFARRTGDELATRKPKGFGVLVFAVAFIAVFALLLGSELGRIEIGLLIIAALLVAIYLGMHIAVALSLLAVIGIWFIRDNPILGVRALKTAATGTIDKFDFGVVPLFVLMGLLVDVADIGKDAYKVAAWTMRKIKSGLGIATVAANAVFAAVTGISIASAAVFTRLAVPQMVKHGYTGKFATGVVAGSSVLGMLIPPSLLLIIYGFVSETSVGRLFLAALLPGILLAGAFASLIILMGRLKPDFVGSTTQVDDMEPETLRSGASKLFPIVLLVFVVMGGIYLGWFTPTQAGAVGAFAALIIALARRRLTWASLWRVLKETGQISITILLLIIAANAFSKMLVMSTIPSQMVEFVTTLGIGFWGFMLAYLVLVIILGMFLDSTSIILIVVPLVLAIVRDLGGVTVGADVLIWFGIVTVIAVEIGLLTPPFGITVYVVKATLQDDSIRLQDIFIGALPFVVAMLAVTLLLIFVPWFSVGWYRLLF